MKHLHHLFHQPNKRFTLEQCLAPLQTFKSYSIQLIEEENWVHPKKIDPHKNQDHTLQPHRNPTLHHARWSLDRKAKARCLCCFLESSPSPLQVMMAPAEVRCAQDKRRRTRLLRLIKLVIRQGSQITRTHGMGKNEAEAKMLRTMRDHGDLHGRSWK